MVEPVPSSISLEYRKGSNMLLSILVNAPSPLLPLLHFSLYSSSFLATRTLPLSLTPAVYFALGSPQSLVVVCQELWRVCYDPRVYAGN